MTQYPPGPVAQPANVPGKTLGLVGLILAIIPCTALIGLVLSIVAFVQARGVGIKNNQALAGIIVAAAWLVISLIVNLTSGVFSTLMNR
ncbi:hypothetical protein [uncultured Friedmanniella sp.]|uniref:hypothetical protein n=1 Tax=uncultured Friedmanniella sp. TaxID=335381 RepID=UPI0035CA96C4